MAELVPAMLRRVASLVADLADGPRGRHHLRARLAAVRRRRRWHRRKAALRRAQPGRPLVVIGLVEHLGDIVASEPIVRQLRREQPEAWLVWAVGERYREVVAHHPELDAVVPVGCLTEWAYLAGSGVFDRVVDLHFEGRGCPRCGTALARADGGGGVTNDNYYALGNLLQVFCRLAGLPPLEDGPTLHIPPSARAAVDRLALPRTFVAIHCTSNEAVRDWTTERWRELTDALLDAGVAVVEVGLRAVVASTAAGYVDLCGRLSLLETAEVIRRARAFVGIDSGPAHLANSVGTFGVVILGAYGPFASYMPYSGDYASGRNAAILHAHGPAAGTAVSTVLDALASRIGVPAGAERS